MSKAFQFKQFYVYDSKSSMKVGTDAVLLGSWANVLKANTILDIGTGCGIITLMLAQRTSAKIDAIDIDKNSIIEAENNIKNTKWSDRIRTLNISLQDFSKKNKNTYDLVISNPPFFINSLKPNDKKLQLAKHTDSLPFETLIYSIKFLLNKNGKFCLILPYNEFLVLKNIIQIEAMFINKITFVRPKKSKEINRVLAEISFSDNIKINTDELCIRNEDNSFTDQYKELTKDFYLRF